MMEIVKWISFLLIILLIVRLAERGRVSSVDFNTASNDVAAALDTSVMTKGNSGTLKQLYDLDSGDYQGFLLYISSANADKAGLTSDQESAPVGVNENGVAEQNSFWAAEPVGTEEFLMIRLDSTSQANEVKKAMEKRVETMKQELKEASASAAAASGESAVSSSSAAGSVESAVSSSTAAGSDESTVPSSAVDNSTESLVSSSGEAAPADAKSLLDDCIIDVVGNYVLFVSAQNAEEVDQLFRQSI